MLGSFANAFKIGELRSRILFTFAMIFIYRLGCIIPTPGVNPEALSSFFSSQAGVLGFLNLFSGGALSRFSVFALGIAPYINASIIMQLLVYVIPALERMAKEEGEEGRKKISQITRYGTVAIGALQALGISFWLETINVSSQASVVYESGWSFRLTAVLTLTAGTAFIMWLGEQMTAKGIGNGISLIITAGIVSRIPSAMSQTWQQFNLSEINPVGLFSVLGVVAVVVAVTAVVVILQDGVRKIPVQHAKRVVGRKVYGGASSHIPLKVNQAGVIPIIFASSVLMFPGLILQWVQRAEWMKAYPQIDKAVIWLISALGAGGALYLVLFALLIIFFSYFYTAIQLNPKEMADNLKKYGGFIPGIRAGRKTAEYIDRVLNRITLAGALFLASVSVLPTLLVRVLDVPFYFGGTALLIVVGVALDTVRQMESHMVTRHYQGFMKR